MIVKINKFEDQFILVERRLINDERLSLKAKGTMVCLLADVIPGQIENLPKAYIEGIRELESHGYLETS